MEGFGGGAGEVLVSAVAVIRVGVDVQTDVEAQCLSPASMAWHARALVAAYKEFLVVS